MAATNGTIRRRCLGAKAWRASSPRWRRSTADSPPARRWAFPAEKLFQGPIADALTHVGQIAMLRRMAGCKIRGENYVKAIIEAGRVGADQAASVVEFD